MDQLPPLPPPMTPSKAPDDNPYNFIMGSGQPGKVRMPKLNGGGSMAKRLIIASIGFFVIVTAIAIFSSVLSSGKKTNQTLLISTAKQQGLLIHIADIGVTKAKSPDAMNLATTTRAALKSDQTTLVAALKKAKIKVNQKDISVSKDEAIDQKLTAAEQANQFDEKFTELITVNLNSYLSALQQTYNATGSKTLQTMLSSEYENAAVIINQKTKS